MNFYECFHFSCFFFDKVEIREVTYVWVMNKREVETKKCYFEMKISLIKNVISRALFTAPTSCPPYAVEFNTVQLTILNAKAR